MKILIIAATHGDETVGIQLYKRLLDQRSDLLEHVDFIIGNPRAYSKNIRYIEADLNRSYELIKDSYESKRADDINRYVTNTRPDIILDMHSTTSMQENCLIVTDINAKRIRNYIQSTHIEHILLLKKMNDSTTMGDNVIGYEICKGNLTSKTLDAIIQDMRSFIDGNYVKKRRLVYEMIDKIYKKDITREEISNLRNYTVSSAGYVPVMIGENSYKKSTNYLGFKTSLPRVFKV